jgi:O-succinylbenzoic acid--CoA ligase
MDCEEALAQKVVVQIVDLMNKLPGDESVCFRRALSAAEAKMQIFFKDMDADAIIICEQNVFSYIAGICVALRYRRPIFFANPNWGIVEWHRLLEMCGRYYILGEKPFGVKVSEEQSSENIPQGLYLATGGSSGKLRFARHSFMTMAEHVKAFQVFYRVEEINSLCALPLFHVSGWMQVMRSAFTGGKIRFFEQQALTSGLSKLDVHADSWFLSLVSMQLRRLLLEGTTNRQLSLLKGVFIGGGAAQMEQVEKAIGIGVPLWLTYGMTETASMVAAVSAGSLEFSAQRLPVLEMMSHTCFKIDDNQHLWLACRSLCKGYWPKEERFCIDAEWYETGDIAEATGEGRLRIIGRFDRLISSGGEKVNPLEVEMIIRQFTGIEDCLVYGEADAEWGQMVKAILCGCRDNVTEQGLREYLKSRIAAYKIPKQFTWVEHMPVNSLGKPAWK